MLPGKSALGGCMKVEKKVQNSFLDRVYPHLYSVWHYLVKKAIAARR